MVIYRRNKMEIHAMQPFEIYDPEKPSEINKLVTRMSKGELGQFRAIEEKLKKIYAGLQSAENEKKLFLDSVKARVRKEDEKAIKTGQEIGDNN